MKSRIKVDWTLILSIIGGVLVILSAIANSIKERKDKKEMKFKDERISSLLEQNANSIQIAGDKIKEVSHLQNKVTELQNELINTSKEILQENKNISDNVTGGSSRPVFAIAFLPYKKERMFDNKFSIVHFDVVNKGKYPIRSLKIKVFDNQSNILDINPLNSEVSSLVIDETEFNRDFYETTEIETLPQMNYYKEFYKGRFLKKLKNFTYIFYVYWMNDQFQLNIEGHYDEAKEKFFVNKISVYPEPINFNPLEYVEVLPENVGEPLKKYFNPVAGESQKMR